MNVIDFPAFFAGLLSAIYEWFMILLVTVVQVITWPINVIITGVFPSFSEQVINLANYLTQMLTFFGYVLTFLPPATLTLVIVIIGTELALVLVFQSTYLVGKLWRIVQNIKFW